MPFIDRVIHTLDSCAQTPYVENKLEDVKEYIKVLMNTRDDMGLESLCNLDINAKNLGVIMSEKIYNIVSKHEYRIHILSIEYDETLAPWQFNFFIRFHYNNNTFQEHSMQITFRNNRYCEIK